MSISEDEDAATNTDQSSAAGGVVADDAADEGDFDDGSIGGPIGPGEDARSPSSAAKWGMAGLLVAYAGLGSYCVVSALDHGTGSDHPEGVTRSVATALGTAAPKADAGAQQGAAARAASTEPAASASSIVTGKAYAAKAFARSQAAATPKVEVLTAVSATAIGPSGASGDHPQVAPLVLDGNSATAWVTHWYESASFGNLKQGTGLVLDMGRMVTIRQIQLALGGSPGFWGADVQIRVGDSPGSWNFAPTAVCTDVGGWVAPEFRSPVTGRYVQIWFTRLPRDSWGTYQEHVYGVTVHGSVPPPSSAPTGAHTMSHGHSGGGHAHGSGHAGGHRGGYGGGHHGGAGGGGHGGAGHGGAGYRHGGFGH